VAADNRQRLHNHLARPEQRPAGQQPARITTTAKITPDM
jgi:hypothetical protein